jgi:hypothetical protein
MPDATTAQRAAQAKDKPVFPFEGFGPEEFELVPREVEPAPEPVAGRREALVGIGARTWPRAAWLGLAVILALGSAGVVAAMSPSDPQYREELTYGADHELQGRLDRSAIELAALNGQVTGLGDQARRLLSRLTLIDKTGLEATYSDGAAALAEIDRLSAGLSQDMECRPWTASRTEQLVRTYSAHLVDEWQQLCQSLESVIPLRDDWTEMVAGSQTAIGVSDAISAHDSLATEALQLATQGRYPDALSKIEDAARALNGTRELAAAMGRLGRDISTLTEWLSRIDEMDRALQTLWREMILSDGRITAQVTAALRAVTQAQALLPGSDTVLSVVVYELAGDLLGQGISIEKAKGQLGAALAALTPPPAD